MEQLRTHFENSLKSKLFNKTNSFNDEQAILLKSLKHFDLYRSGTVDLNGWVKGLEKAGLSVKSHKDLKQLFDYYDKRHNGEIDYNNFVAQIFARQSDSYRSIGKDDTDTILSKMKTKLKDRGVRGLIGLAKTFTSTKKDAINFLEFKQCLLQTQFDYPEQDLLKVYSRFESGRGELDYKVLVDYFRVLVRNNYLGEFEPLA